MNQHWPRHWYYIADEQEVPNPGDFKSLIIAEQPILVVRGVDGQICVLFNICRHREVMVCHEQRGNTKQFVCPFHGWMYDISGNLIGLVGPDEHIRAFRARRGLTPLPRMGIVRGCIFASLNPDGEDLETYLRRTGFFEGRGT